MVYAQHSVKMQEKAAMVLASSQRLYGIFLA